MKPEPNGLWLIGKKLGLDISHDGVSKYFDGLHVALTMAQYRDWIKMNFAVSRTYLASDHPLFLERPDENIIGFRLGATTNTSYQSKTYYRQCGDPGGVYLATGLPKRINGLKRNEESLDPSRSDRTKESIRSNDIDFLSRAFNEFSPAIRAFFGAKNESRALGLLDNLKTTHDPTISRFHLNL